MRTKLLIVGMLFLLVPWLLAGCGVAQEQYDDVVADLNQASKDLQSVGSELQAAQDKVSELTSSLDKTQASLKAAETENSELTSSLEKAESELQAGSTELAAGVQKIQAELEAAQAKVSELTSRLEEVENELETTKSEYEAFKSEVESLLVLSLEQHLALKEAILDVQSALKTSLETKYMPRFRSAVTTVEDMLADLNGVKADRLRSYWNDAYYIERVQVTPYYDPRRPLWYIWEDRWGLNDSFWSFNRLNDDIILTLRTLLRVY